MRHAVTQRLELRNVLSTALRADALRVDFQPIVDLRDGRTVGFEALAELGPAWLVTAELLSLANDLGLHGEITTMTLRSAAHEAAEWAHLAPDRQLSVTVNVPPLQLQSPGFADGVLAVLAEAGLSPDRLILDITNEPRISDEPHATAELQRLHALGVRIAVDDFGSGRFGVSYLQRLPLDAVKLDFSLIHNDDARARPRDIVAGVVDFAAALHLDIVGQGLATADDRILARDAGCTYAQGPAVSHPLTPAQTRQWIATHP
jgi:EAL domain-containing protein (putative c-di-GMP-specific phosphodiesterase class I)